VSQGPAYDDGVTAPTDDWPVRRAEIARDLLVRLYQAGFFKTWYRDQPTGWELVSGLWSPFYISMRSVPSQPELFRMATSGLAEVIRHEAPEANRVLGLATTGIPLAAAVGYAEGIPMSFNRKVPDVRNLADLEQFQQQVTQYGGHAMVEGEFAPGDRVAVIDDVVNLFDSKAVGIKQLEFEMQRRGLDDVAVAAVVTLVDRGRDARQRASEAGVALHSLVRFADDGVEMLRGVASDVEVDVIREYFDDYERFQDEKVQQELRELALGR
jgi:orotate phosphoribosyltransferase